MELSRLEIAGGIVSGGPPWRLEIPESVKGYTNAQIDDYHKLKRRKYLWTPGLELSLRARFSHVASELVGTAGFGFWNAPFADPTTRWPALPQAVWFFFASKPSNLPLDISGPGRDWFVSTTNVSTKRMLAISPLTPAIFLLNQIKSVRVRIWPWLRDYFGITFHPLREAMDQWHDYGLSWNSGGCEFSIDGQRVHQTAFSPAGPLGLVCWIDNQFLVLTTRGFIKWGTIEVHRQQWLEIENLEINRN